MTAPASLTETIKNLGQAARTLAEESEADRASRALEAAAARAEARQTAHRQTVLLVIIGVLVAAIGALTVYSRIAAAQSRSVIKTIESCTSTDGECAKKGREQTAAAIGQLIAMQIEVESCGRDPKLDDQEYRRCVAAAMAEIGTPLTGDPTSTPASPSVAPVAPPPPPPPMGD